MSAYARIAAASRSALARAASPFHAWNAEPQVDRRKKCAAFRALSRRGTSQATYADHAANTRRETTRP